MSGKKTGLGRGLEALIPTAGHGEFARIPIADISPNPSQPRARFDDDALSALAESIGAIGLLQPVVVTESEEGGFVLIAGERRWRAAKRAGLSEIPAVIRQEGEVGSLTEALIENLQREDLTPLEEASAYQQLLSDQEITHEEIASRVGKSRSAITNTIRLLQLPATIQGMLERGEINAGHARALLGIDDRAYAEHIAERTAAEGWSVRQVEDAARARKELEDGKNARPKVRQIRPVEIIELEQRLTEQLGTKVNIAYRNEKGKLEISFATLDDLERLYRRFFA